jgi:copper transport protein
LKWIALVSLAAVAGAAFFLAVVLRPAASFLEDEAYKDVNDAGERWLVNLSHVLLPAAFIATAFLVLLTVSRFETSLSLWSYLTDVRTGQYRGLGLILLLVALAGADLLFLGNTKARRNAGLMLALIATAGAMLSYSMISHSATGTGKFWAVSSDFVHFSASAAWLGALAMVPLVLRQRSSAMSEAERFLFQANLFDRFSVVAGVSVAIVMATGVFNGLAEIPTWEALRETTYGRVLLAKLALVLPLLVIAGVNAFVLKPLFVGAVDGLYQQGGSGTVDQQRAWSEQLRAMRRWLPRTIVIEVALVIAVFAAVAVLSQTSTAEGEIAQERAEAGQGQAFDQSAETDGVRLTLQVRPNVVGINEYTLLVQDAASGEPIETVTQARLRFEYDDVEGAVAPSEIILNRFGAGDYRGAGAYFTQPGNWRVAASIRRSDGDDAARTFVLPVVREEAGDTAEGDAFDLPFTSFYWNEVLAAALAIAGVLLLLYRRQLKWMASWANRGVMTVAAVLLIAAGVLAFGVHTHTDAIDAREGNPIPPSEESVARGRELFQQNCIQCHGIDGRGDGPAAEGLNPAPTDFRLHVPLHTDPQFYAFIADGYPGSAMPAFRDAFSEEDIWNLVNFIRETFKDAPTE